MCVNVRKNVCLESYIPCFIQKRKPRCVGASDHQMSHSLSVELQTNTDLLYRKQNSVHQSEQSVEISKIIRNYLFFYNSQGYHIQIQEIHGNHIQQIHGQVWFTNCKLCRQTEVILPFPVEGYKEEPRLDVYLTEKGVVIDAILLKEGKIYSCCLPSDLIDVQDVLSSLKASGVQDARFIKNEKGERVLILKIGILKVRLEEKTSHDAKELQMRILAAEVERLKVIIEKGELGKLDDALDKQIKQLVDKQLESIKKLPDSALVPFTSPIGAIPTLAFAAPSCTLQAKNAQIYSNTTFNANTYYEYNISSWAAQNSNARFAIFSVCVTNGNNFADCSFQCYQYNVYSRFTIPLRYPGCVVFTIPIDTHNSYGTPYICFDKFTVQVTNVYITLLATINYQPDLHL
eukprot:TRINITY_DN89742_c0_g1_i1.p1 TRINITY_DN89742_c0_g1~~TRINITY_DN89742_c0_g1_i1.p1  ORF type:complete len:474 (-),score=-13.88 TRINITY_DN89742_c0_g1_i1:144-1352(-)